MIKSMLHKVHTAMRLLRRNTSWIFDTILLRGCVHPRQMQYKVKGKILILFPHSDDEWIGCSQLIKQSDKVVLCNMDMSGGDTPQIHLARRNESKMISDKYHKRMVLIRNDKSHELEDLIYSFSPDFICVPYYIDWHPEHFKVMNILKEALINTPNLDKCGIKILMYGVSVPVGYEEVNALSVMTFSCWLEKWRTFRTVYRTQKAFPFRRFFWNEVIDGGIVGAWAAETYSVIEVSEWIRLLQCPTEEQTETIKATINNIKKIRQNTFEIRKHHRWQERNLE